MPACYVGVAADEAERFPSFTATITKFREIIRSIASQTKISSTGEMVNPVPGAFTVYTDESRDSILKEASGPREELRALILSARSDMFEDCQQLLRDAGQ